MEKFQKIFNRYRHDESGSTAVEFGLIAVGFIALLFGIIETGRLFMTWNAFQYSFEKASRTALVTADITAQEIEDNISNQLSGLFVSPDFLDVTVSFTAEASGMNFVDIQGTYDYQLIVPLLPASWDSLQLTARSRLPR